MNDEQTTGGVRRFGRKDRKRSLDPRGPLFPPEADAAFQRSSESELEVEVPQVEVLMPDELPAVDAPVNPAPQKPVVRRTANSGKHILANLLTLLFLLGTVGAGWVIFTIASNPYTPLNPFPPFTPLPIIITATFLPPTETPRGTEAPTATFTPLAVEDTNITAFAFSLKPAQPIYVPNANPEGCNWSSIAGTVTTAQGTAVDGYRIHITGNGLDETVFSGAAVTFGAGGFELFINGTAQEQTFTVQLLDPQQQPLSPEYSVTTRTSCDENVAILSFVGS